MSVGVKDHGKSLSGLVRSEGHPFLVIISLSFKTFINPGYKDRYITYVLSLVIFVIFIHLYLGETQNGRTRYITGK